MLLLAPLIPRFDSFVTEEVILPYRNRAYLRFRYSDPLLAGYEVIVVADSVGSAFKRGEGWRIVTIIGRFPRCILSEVNTHRNFGRNSASSRAKNVRATITDVMTAPYIPLFTKNKKGMSGPFLTESAYERAREVWLDGRDQAVTTALRLLMGDLVPRHVNLAEDYEAILDRYYAEVYEADDPVEEALSVHKQDANRVLEPFAWHEAIITSAYWQNFLDLRTNLLAAQPAIVAFAKLVEKALLVSDPEETWLHLPFVKEEDRPAPGTPFAEMRPVLMLSSTESAQISYRDKSSATVSTATTALGERLLGMKHFSPFEHVGFTSESWPDVSGDLVLDPKVNLGGNLGPEWVQLRKVFEALRS